MDFGSIAKKAQDALTDGADKLQTALKDNSGKIEDAVDKAGRFAKEKFPDRAEQIDSAAGKAKAAVPRHGDAATPGATSPVPDAPQATSTPPLTVVPTHTAPDPAAPSWSPPGSSTPEVDRAAAAAVDTQPSSTPTPGQPSSAGFAPPSPTPEVDRVVRDQE